MKSIDTLIVEDNLDKMLTMANYFGFVEDEDDQRDMSDYSDKVCVLAMHLGLEDCYPEMDNLFSSYGNYYIYGVSEYLVLTDTEAEDMLYDCLIDYANETVYKEIPDHLHIYFDLDRWLVDMEFNINRGEWLSSHDDAEHTIYFDCECYYIYKTS